MKARFQPPRHITRPQLVVRRCHGFNLPRVGAEDMQNDALTSSRIREHFTKLLSLLRRHLLE